MKHKIKGQRAFSNDRLVSYLQGDIQPGTTLLDLGCGPKLYSDPLRNQCSRVLTVDAWDWVEPDIVANLETTDLCDIVTDCFDYVLMLDFIEHLDKSAGVALIAQAKKICQRRIYLLTPLEEIWTDNHENVNDPNLWCYGNKFDIHKSLWTTADFSGWTRIDLPSLDNYFLGYYEA
jgi:hypothetical protein